MNNFKKYLINVKGYSPSTANLYCKYATKLVAKKLDYQKALFDMNDISNTTKRVVLSAFKKYFHFIKDERWKEIELPKKEIKVKDFLTFEEYKNILLKMKSHTFLLFQKQLIFKILFETGIRSSEILKIRKEDVKKDKILIRGKGFKERYVLISEWLSFELEKYINNIKDDLLFSFGYKNLYSKIASIKASIKLTPHILRRSFANHCIKKNISIYDLSILMGHENINTTAAYVNGLKLDIDQFKTIFQ